MFGLIRLIDLSDTAVEFWWNTSLDRFGSQLFFGQDKWTCDVEYDQLLKMNLMRNTAVNLLHILCVTVGGKEVYGLEGEMNTFCIGFIATLVGQGESYTRKMSCWGGLTASSRWQERGIQRGMYSCRIYCRSQLTREKGIHCILYR